MTTALRGLRRTGIGIGLLMLFTINLLWWYMAPMRASAQDATFTVGKVDSTRWHPERNEPIFILVLGSDARRAAPDGGGGRCDSIHIVAINPGAKGGTILNFPRDSWVPVTGLGTTKINSACTRGGGANMVSTLKALTGIPIQYYVITEFSHFVAFIDEIGPIDIPVPYRMRDPYSGADFLPGNRPMLGTQALAFSRNRHDTPRGDFSRSENQGTLIKASLGKYRNEANADAHRVFQYMRIARRHVSTDVPILELIKLAEIARDIDPNNIQNITINGSTGSAGGASVVFLAPGDTYARVRDDGLY